MSMDLDLLASPQLYSLECTVLCQSSPANLSEFPVLTQILLQSSKLRVLRLACVSDSRFQFKDYQSKYATFGTDGSGPLNLFLKAGDKFPPLEQLAFISPTHISPTDDFSPQLYRLSRDHCLVMKESMDLSKLRTLDLGRTSSHVFFAELAGYVPNLKSLSFTIPNPSVSHQSTGYIQSVTAEFLEPLSNLQELYIHNQSMQDYPKLWPIIRRHASTLQKLSMDVPETQIDDTPEVPLSSGFQFPGVLSSWRRTAKPDGRQTSEEGTIYDHSVQLNTSFFKMRAFPHLCTLNVSLKLEPPTSFQLGLNANTIEGLVETVICNFFRKDPKSKMEVLEFRVWRMQPGFHANGLERVVVKVARSSGSVVPKLKEGG
ncbi:hypothetical protein BKA61DRAFT_578638 [Leptodontidium sp. MPI-SDFR-AT-0119]|nr:hypothetical protein BKA61DRAFT_578638 [Leptodontidium sp. MPI-SDFR-AT-0119]